MPRCLPHTLALALGLSGLSACAFEIDAGLTKRDQPDGSDALTGPDGPDADVDVEPDGPDANIEPDASDPDTGPDLDASQDGGLDAGVTLDASLHVDATTPTADASVPVPYPPDAEAGVVPCSRDVECGANAICLVEGRCSPTCDATRGCAGPRLARPPLTLYAQGDSVVWSTGPTTDALGNPLANGEIWRWDGEHAPETIATGLKFGAYHVFGIVDGFAYVDGLDGTLRRVDLSAGTSETLASATRIVSLWTTSSHIWWSTSQNTGVSGWKYRLYRMNHPASEPELVREAPGNQYGAGFLTGTEDFVIFAPNAGDPLTRESIDGSSSTSLGTFGTSVLFESPSTDGRQVYCNFGSSLIGFDADAARPFRVLGKFIGGGSDITPLNTPYQRLDNWIYWRSAMFVEGGMMLQFGRTPTDLHRDAEVLATFLRRESTVFTYADNLAVSSDGTHVRYYDPYEGRLYTLNISALPCAAGTACPAGLACQSDMTCH